MMTTRTITCGVFLTIALGATIHVRADSRKAVPLTPEEFEASLGYRTGVVTVGDRLATIRLPQSFRYVGPEGSRRLLEAWGNPPSGADGVLGMLVSSAVSPVSEEGWGIVITYDDEGYVDDQDAATIDYDRLLAEMKEATAAENEQRRKQGFEPVTLVGWAEPPSYDPRAHKLYWARELAFGDSTEHTLNYCIRILGRRGVLVLNAVSGMDQLTAVRSSTADVLAAVDFNEGHRYVDYLPGQDKLARYGLTGLIVGATAAKAGLFKALWIGILAFKKLLFVAVVALVGMIRRLFGRSPARARS